MSDQPNLTSMLTPDGREIRKVWHQDEWYFSVVDVLAELLETDYKRSQSYWSTLKQRLKQEGNESITKCERLKLMAADKKMRLTDVINTEQSLRLIQSIPSPKVEHMKLWLAGVGAERLEETTDPESYEENLIIQGLPDSELARRKRQERRIQNYRDMGRDDTWITIREIGIVTRLGFTMAIKQWTGDKVNYGQITNDVYRGVHHRDAKQLRADLGIQSNQSPRDYMFSMGLSYIHIAEQACHVKLSHLSDDAIVPPKLIRDIIILISKQVGAQADQMALEIGIDLVTGKPLLPGSPNVYKR